MTGKEAVFLLSIVMVGSAVLGGACGSGSDDSAGVNANPGSETATPAVADSASRAMLQAMMPGATDLQGFTLSEADFYDNEQDSANARDPAAQLARLNEMGRVTGYNAMFVPSADAPAGGGGPATILWSVSLFQEPAGALEFIKQSPEMPVGETVKPLDVSSLGPNTVGFAFQYSDPARPASAFSVAFAEGVIEVSVSVLYQGTGFSPDYTLSLAQQARTLVESGIGSGSAPHAPQAPLEGAPVAAGETQPTEIAGGMQVPMRAVVGTPEP